MVADVRVVGLEPTAVLLTRTGAIVLSTANACSKDIVAGRIA
jgi:hypothetical protein